MFKTLQKYKHFSDYANYFALLLPLFTTFMTAYKKLLLSLPPKRHELGHNAYANSAEVPNQILLVIIT